MKRNGKKMNQTFNIESDNSQNGGLDDYNYISDGIFPHFSRFFQIIQIIIFFRAIWTVLDVSNFQKKWSKKNWSQNIWSQKKWSKKFGPNKFGLKKFGPKIIWVPNRLVLKKFGPEKIGPKKIGPKILVPRNQF